MKKLIRFLKSIPYFCLAFTIIACSLMMAIPASAAPLVGNGYYGPPYYSFDTVPSGLPSGHLPDFVSYAPNDCFLVERYAAGSSTPETYFYVAETPGSMRVSFQNNGYSISGRYYYSLYNSSSQSWLSPSLKTYASSYTNLSSYLCVVTPSLLSSSTLSNVVVSSVTHHVSSTGVLDVAGGVGSWLVSALGNVFQMFYADGALTFLGYLAIAGLAFSVIFLVIAIVSRFLKFGG